jgi:hypothetical protein
LPTVELKLSYRRPHSKQRRSFGRTVLTNRIQNREKEKEEERQEEDLKERREEEHKEDKRKLKLL